MIKLTCIENYITKEKDQLGVFSIEPLEIGQGITLGNALRRTLLSEIRSYAITGVRISNVQHEFDAKEGLREDILEILLNLKEVIFRTPFAGKDTNIVTKFKGFINVRGPIIVTAGMFRLPYKKIQVLNPNQYICTIFSAKQFYLEVDIEEGKGYKFGNEIKKDNLNDEFFPNQGTTLLSDTNFTPIKKANYKVKLIHDTQGNIKESLNLEVLTNGSISPKRSILESVKVLMNLLYPLFVNEKFDELSELFQKQFIKNR